MKETLDNDRVLPTPERPFPYYDAHVHAWREEQAAAAAEKKSVAEYMEASMSYARSKPKDDK